MSRHYFEPRDATTAALHTMVSVIDHQLAGLPEPETESIAELRAFWRELVQLLALRPVPEVRECPACKHVGIADARRCGSCWTKLLPVPGAP